MRCAREFRHICGDMLRHLKHTATAGKDRSIGAALLSVRDAAGTLPRVGSGLWLPEPCTSSASRLCRPGAA